MSDPTRLDAEERDELIRYALERGATAAEVDASTNLGELALDLHLRPRTAMTFRDVAEEVGIDWVRAERLLTASGLPVDPDARVTAGEAATLRLLTTVGRDVLGDEATVQLARVAGSATARVAEAIVSAFRLQFELPRRAAGTPYVDVVKEYATIAETLLPAFVETLDVLLRRQIVGVAERMWTTDDERSTVTLPRTIGFADLVGYTAAASSMSLRELAGVLVEFDERTADVVRRGGGQVVKTIGDEVMFLTEDPGDACAIALELVERFGHDGLPPVRAGLAAGDVVSVFGDVYGPEVNRAARLVRIAEPSTVVVSAAVRAGCGAHFTFRELAPVTLKGFADPEAAYVVAASRPDGAA